jgi:glyoxylase-like metal-dependent hydrolase (beta-lactamase superfamily II)
MSTTESHRFYFRQLLSGQDFAQGNMMATQMVNFAYLLGDRDSGECVIVDPAYAVHDIVSIAEDDGMKVVGALASHYHADHIGGSMMGHTIQGISSLLEECNVPIHVNENEVPWVVRTTGLTEKELVAHSSGDIVKVGELEIVLVHTPGHTPGSQCFLVNGCLVSGDTLFLDGCGRTDLPGSDVGQMYESLSRLATLPDETVVLPGHRYSEPPAARLSDVKQHNYVFKPKTKEAWLTMFGHD